MGNYSETVDNLQITSSAIPLPSSFNRKDYLTSLFIALAGAILFSTKAIIVKLLYRYHLDALTVITFRMLMSLPFFATVAVWKTFTSAPLPKSDYGPIIVLGFLGYYLATFLDFLGLQYISAGLERLILFLAPSFVLLISAVFLKKKISSHQWLALVVSYAGIALVFMHDAREWGAHVALGSLYVLGSAVSYASYLLLSGELVKRVGAIRLVAYVMCVSSAVCITQFLLQDSVSTLMHQPPQVYYLSLANAIFCTVMPVSLTMIAISRIGAGIASQASMVGPVSTLFLGAWFLNEPITFIQIVGTVLVLAGIYFLSRKRE